ncbi:MAG: hypothetical protein ACUZ8O_16030 [Candidatus Anammoxibacter sp.]
MEEASKTMNDPATFCLNIPIKQINALGYESVQGYIDKIVFPFYEKQGITLEVINVSSTEIYELALQKAIDHAKTVGFEAEVENNKVASIRLSKRNFEEGKSTETIEFVRVVKLSGNEKNFTKDNPNFKQGNIY